MSMSKTFIKCKKIYSLMALPPLADFAGGKASGVGVAAAAPFPAAAAQPGRGWLALGKDFSIVYANARFIGRRSRGGASKLHWLPSKPIPLCKAGTAAPASLGDNQKVKVP